MLLRSFSIFLELWTSSEAAKGTWIAQPGEEEAQGRPYHSVQLPEGDCGEVGVSSSP